ncbi:hypothetical protein CI238_13656, partial [Colletotrichum incanum]
LRTMLAALMSISALRTPRQLKTMLAVSTLTPRS